jgi:flavin reductase (DIM6/NTAB) family NADH-FMN oxidoreductase RutF
MIHSALETEFDERRFRDTLGRFPTGVAIVTTIADDGERIGLTISSFNSVSLSPPLVLFSVGKRALSLPIWRAAGSYAVNVLSEAQQTLSNRFGRPSSEKWTDLDVDMLGENPVFNDAIAVFVCKAFDRIDAGDHEIFIGRVVALRQSIQSAPRPLLFYSGQYRKIDNEIVGIPRYEGQFW